MADHPDATERLSGPPTEVQPKRPGRNLWFAVVTGLTLAGLVIGLLNAGPRYFFGLAFVVILIAQAELYGAIRKSGRNPATALGLVGGASMLLAAFLDGPGGVVAVLFLTILFSLVWFLAARDSERFVSDVGATLLGVVYVPLLGSFAVLLVARPSEALGTTITMIGLAAIYDVLAYAAGSRLGKTFLAKRISPNKTIEGAVAATVGVTILSGLLAQFFGPWNVWQGLVLGLAAAVASPLGDLSESLLKRDFGIKDMGTVFPGHGGALDRIDAILFVAPVVYLSLWIFRL